MKRFFLTLFLFVVVLNYYGCQKPGCLGSAGPIISQERQLTPFNHVILEGNIDLELVQGDTEKIEITAPENIIPNIQSFITDQVLTLTNSTDCRWLRNADEKIKVKLFFKDLLKFDYNGSGNVSNADTLRLDEFYLHSEEGAGNIELTVDNGYTWSELLKENASLILHGQSTSCYTYTNARAQTDMSDFVVKTMSIVYSGLADTHIHVTETLDATIRYKGNVYYKGNPVITKSDYFSSGRLIKTP